MITIRPRDARRHIRSAAQETWRTFDSENAGDPLRDGFRALATLDELLLQPGQRLLARAPNADGERITYVVAGSLLHRDTPGGRQRLPAGGFRAAAGMAAAGAANGSRSESAEVLEAVIRTAGSKSSVERKRYLVSERRGVLRLIASPDGQSTSSLRVGPDVRVYSSVLDPGTHLVHALLSGRGAWLHVVSGRIRLLEQELVRGDGAGLSDEPAVSLTALEASEILLFDLA